jgi:hypothetical protein
VTLAVGPPLALILELAPALATSPLAARLNQTAPMCSIYASTFILPLALLSFIYFRMGIKLWRHRTPGNENANRDSTMQMQRNKVSMRRPPVYGRRRRYRPGARPCPRPDDYEQRQTSLIQTAADLLGTNSSRGRP